MTNRSNKEIAYMIRNESMPKEESYKWLASASANELREFLQYTPIGSPWSQLGRDALNILLANENIKLQTEIKNMTDKMKKMTKWIVGLTVVIVFLTLLQAYFAFFQFYNSFGRSNNPVANTANTKAVLNNPTSTDNHSNETGKIKQSDKTNIINHK